MAGLKKAKWICESRPMSVTKGKVYDVLSIDKGWYRIKADPPISDEVLYPAECFEIADTKLKISTTNQGKDGKT